MIDRSRGFTLMETLVMLIVSALAVTMMFQALASFSRSRQRIAALEGVRDNRAVLFGWISDSIRGIVAIDPASLPVSESDDPQVGLRGDSRGFEASTISPLMGTAGVPAVIRWELQDAPHGARLVYHEAGRAPLFFALGESVHFEYLDEKGQLHRTWPPKLGEQKALPDVIELTADDGDRHVLVAGSIAAPYPQRLAPYDLEVDQ